MRRGCVLPPREAEIVLSNDGDVQGRPEAVDVRCFGGPVVGHDHLEQRGRVALQCQCGQYELELTLLAKVRDHHGHSRFPIDRLGEIPPIARNHPSAVG